MPVAGLTVTLNEDEALASAAVGEMFAKDEILLGEVDGRYLAAVMDTPNSRASRKLHGWIEALPGVDFVDVVYVGFDEDAGAAAGPQPPAIKQQSS